MTTPTDPTTISSTTPLASATRRGLLAGSAAVGIAAGLSTIASEADAKPRHTPPGHAKHGAACGWKATNDMQFTLAVMPDTQYLFADPAIHGDPVKKSLQYLKSQRKTQRIVHLAHIGDLVQNANEVEFAAIRRAFDEVGDLGMGVSTLTGNHDVNSRTDDQRGETPYLTHFRPQAGARGLLAVSPDGYNSAWTFAAAGQIWLLLALDWRLSATGLAWAKGILAEHQHPTILTTHEIVHANGGDGVAQLSPYGTVLWERLVKDHDQIFLTVNGHFWPVGRTQLTNAAGHQVELDLANYQERYYGGAAAMRLYHFDLERKVIDVETVVPWADSFGDRENELMRTSLTLTGSDDHYSIEIDFEERLADFWTVREPAAKSVRSQLRRDTVAYWRWDQAPSLTAGAVVKDLSGHGNDLVVVDGGTPMTIVEKAHDLQPGRRSLSIGNDEATGDHLRTVDGAPINAERFTKGYTFEAFFSLPVDWDGKNAWSSLISRAGQAADADRVEDDKEEPLATLSLSGSRELQWCVYPDSLKRSLTNWGHELALGQFWHVAVTNDGRHTTMYVDGCEVVRNPGTVNRGLATVDGKDGMPRGWFIGAYTWANELDKVFQGLIGDIRISNRALDPSEFMVPGRRITR